jgi:heme/copper-type cytochrome/quinol oxidase subunit 2
MREWTALPTGKRQTEEQTQRIVNAFFFSMTIFAVVFACFVLSARAQDHHHPPIHALSFSGVGV